MFLPSLLMVRVELACSPLSPAVYTKKSPSDEGLGGNRSKEGDRRVLTIIIAGKSGIACYPLSPAVYTKKALR